MNSSNWIIIIMYINQPIIKNKRKFRKTNPTATKPNTKPIDQQYFQSVMLQQVDDLMLKCKQTYISTQAQGEQLSHINFLSEDEEAYVECMQLLMDKFENQTLSHQHSMDIISKKIVQIEDYKIRLEGELQQLKQECFQLEEEKRTSEDQLFKYSKGEKRVKSLQQQIQKQIHKINQLKQAVSETSSQKYKLNKQMQQMDYHQQSLEEELRQAMEEESHLQQLQQLNSQYQNYKLKRQKILRIKKYVQNQVQPHLERKINKMAYLRAQLQQLTSALIEVGRKIQDQNYIINGLKDKAYLMEDELGDNLFTQYRNKYEELYYSNTGQSWQEYSEYIDHLVKRNKRIRTESQVESMVESRKRGGVKLPKIQRNQSSLYELSELSSQ